MRGFVLYHGPKNPDIEALLQAAKEMRIDIDVVDPRKITVLVDPRQKRLLVDGKEVAPPDFAIVAFVNDPSYGNSAAALQLEQMGVFCINRVDVAKTTNDKLKTTQLVTAADIPVPKTLLVRFPFDYELIGKEFGYPLILKLVKGSQGQGVVMVHSRKELESILTIARSGQINGELIIQEYIETSKGRNLRVIVYGRKAQVCVIRENTNRNEFRSNVAVGAKESYYPMDETIRGMSDRVAQTLGLFVGGIDLLFAKDGYVVCEVNSMPGFYGDYDKLYNGVHVPKELLKAIEEVL